MEKQKLQDYEPLAIEVVKVKLEQGFAASNEEYDNVEGSWV